MEIYKHKSYREALKSWLKEQPKEGRGMAQKIAKTLNISTVLVSQILSGNRVLQIDYAFHLAESQAFVDGNKRTAVAAAMVFLARNGVYARPPTLTLYLAMIDVAEKRKTQADLAEIFRKCAEPEDSE